MRKVLLSTLCLLYANLMYAGAKKYDFLIGTYTVNTSSEGIYSLHLDFKNSIFEVKLRTADVANPSYLAISKNKKQVFSVSELGDKSSLSSFLFDKKMGTLKLINMVGGVGADPCYVALSKKHVVTANYSGGNIDVIERNSNGSMAGIAQTIQHIDKEKSTDKQLKAHVHQTVFSSNYKYLLVNDLGLDKLISYKYDGGGIENILTPFDTLNLKPKSGPRHLTFSKDGKYIYLLHELDGTVSVIRYQDGKLKFINENTVARKSNIKTGAADIHISPDGNFLYATNRGSANDITCFAIEKDAKLRFVEQISVEGISPRNFSITKDGRYILVANQRSNQIVVFKRDKKSGKLIDTDIRVDVGAPVCIQEY